jgi:Cu2+-exporting ATPase
MSGTAAIACFHCALPVPGASPVRARVLGAEREFCCPGCAAVACAIESAGLGGYYATRTTPGARAVSPQDLLPTTLLEEAATERLYAAHLDARLRETTLMLERMSCAACAWLIEASLLRIPGVALADVNATTRRAVVRWDADRTNLARLVDAIRAIGYDAWPWDPARAKESERAERRSELWRLFVAGFGAMQVMMYALPGYLDGGATMSAEASSMMRWASLAITLPVMFVSCRPFFESAWRELQALRVGLDAPIALGIAGGFLASTWATVTGSGEVYFDSISMLAFLLLAARWAQSAARRRAGLALDGLLRWMPAMASRLRDPASAASAERVQAQALRAGDHVLIGPGERVPADGVVVQGSSSVDESLLTGESRPVQKWPGTSLIGGAVNVAQPLVMRVTRAGADAWAAGIARLVERATASRPDILPGADRAARALCAIVIAFALAAFLAWLHFAPERAVWIAVAVLVATCPCALGLAAPIALTAASARLLRHGIVMTRAQALESLARATDVVFDKTGTLTEGQFALAAAQAHGKLDRDACFALACAIEATSRHPLARVFRAAAAPLASVADSRHVPGLGIEADVDGKRVRIGNLAFCAELAGSPAPAAACADDARHTQVHLAREGEWLASFALEDSLRPEAAALVRGLHADGLRVHLLSGDREATVAELAGRLGIATHAAGCTPEAKLAYVESLQRAGGTVVMVGDGLNDAPVLAQADCSIAVGGGADAAQLQSDLVLLGGRTGAAAEAFGIARHSIGIVRQNIGWALAYNAIALPLAAAGAVGPWEAAIGMSASSLIVAANALRVLSPGNGRKPWNPSISSSPSPSRSSS